jgi:hypothetical protein
MVATFGSLEGLWDRRLNRPLPVEKHTFTWQNLHIF